MILAASGQESVADQLGSMAPLWWIKSLPSFPSEPTIICDAEDRHMLRESYNRAYVWMFYARQMILRIWKTIHTDPAKAHCMWMWGAPGEPIDEHTEGQPYPWYWFGNWQGDGPMISFLKLLDSRCQEYMDAFLDPPVVVCSDQVGLLGAHAHLVNWEENWNIPKEAAMGILRDMFENYGCPTTPKRNANPFTFGNVIAYCQDSEAMGSQTITHETGHRYPGPDLHHFYDDKSLDKYCEETHGAPKLTPPFSSKSYARYLAKYCPIYSLWNTDSFANFAQAVGQTVLAGGLRDWGQDCQLGLALPG